jgi:hypothetical protein
MVKSLDKGVGNGALGLPLPAPVPVGAEAVCGAEGGDLAPLASVLGDDRAIPLDVNLVDALDSKGIPYVVGPDGRLTIGNPGVPERIILGGSPPAGLAYAIPAGTVIHGGLAVGKEVAGIGDGVTIHGGLDLWTATRLGAGLDVRGAIEISRDATPCVIPEDASFTTIRDDSETLIPKDTEHAWSGRTLDYQAYRDMVASARALEAAPDLKAVAKGRLRAFMERPGTLSSDLGQLATGAGYLGAAVAVVVAASAAWAEFRSSRPHTAGDPVALREALSLDTKALLDSQFGADPKRGVPGVPADTEAELRASVTKRVASVLGAPKGQGEALSGLEQRLLEHYLANRPAVDAMGVAAAEAIRAKGMTEDRQALAIAAALMALSGLIAAGGRSWVGRTAAAQKERDQDRLAQDLVDLRRKLQGAPEPEELIDPERQEAAGAIGMALLAMGGSPRDIGEAMATELRETDLSPALAAVAALPWPDDASLTVAAGTLLAAMAADRPTCRESYFWNKTLKGTPWDRPGNWRTTSSLRVALVLAHVKASREVGLEPKLEARALAQSLGCLPDDVRAVQSNGGLDYRRHQYTHGLLEGYVVPGDLLASGTELSGVKDVHVEGNLDLRGCVHLTSIGADCFIGKELDLRGCSLWDGELEGVSVGGTIICDEFPHEPWGLKQADYEVRHNPDWRRRTGAWLG